MVDYCLAGCYLGPRAGTCARAQSRLRGSLSKYLRWLRITFHIGFPEPESRSLPPHCADKQFLSLSVMLDFLYKWFHVCDDGSISAEACCVCFASSGLLSLLLSWLQRWLLFDFNATGLQHALSRLMTHQSTTQRKHVRVSTMLVQPTIVLLIIA